MVNVLHFDYRPDMMVESIYALQKYLKNFPEIHYQMLNPQPGMQGFEYNQSRLEALLPAQDVLLVHPGVHAQGIVMEEYPRQFPQLSIGVLSFCEGDYDPPETVPPSKIYVLSYKNAEKIVQFILDRASERK